MELPDFLFDLALGSEKLIQCVLRCYITIPHFTRGKKQKTKSRFSDNNFTCSAVKSFLHRTFNKSTLSPDSKYFRACLSPHQVNQTKSQVKKSCLPVVQQVFHIPLHYVNYGRCSVLLHCFMSAVIQKQQHQFTLLTVPLALAVPLAVAVAEASGHFSKVEQRVRACQTAFIRFICLSFLNVIWFQSSVDLCWLCLHVFDHIVSWVDPPGPSAHCWIRARLTSAPSAPWEIGWKPSRWNDTETTFQQPATRDWSLWPGCPSSE